MTGGRPFYESFAWAYDLLADRPVEEECACIAGVLGGLGLPAGARILDAGCATGRYALALEAHGYRATGVDRSPDLLAVARRRGARVVAGDLVALPVRGVYGAVLCRGVLNDVLEDDDRRAVFRAFAGALADGGALVLDVRDWEQTLRRKTADPVHLRTIETAQGRLTFRSETRLDPPSRRMLIAERHTLERGCDVRSGSYDFVMRCWTRAELAERLAEAGFAGAEYRGGYGANVPLGATDRIVAVALRRPGILKP